MNMVGFNIEKINELMETINNKFNQVGAKIAEPWPGVSSFMQDRWIGYDEIDYEGELAAKYVNLYRSCEETVTVAITNIANAGRKWIQAQNENRFSGADNYSAGTLTEDNIHIPNINVFDIASIVKANDHPISSGANMGLVGGVQAGADIIEKINEYNSNIEEAIKGLFGQVDSANAFLSAEQSDAVTQYIAKVGDALKATNTNVDEIKNALGTLAGTKYTDTASSVQGEMNSYDPTANNSSAS